MTLTICVCIKYVSLLLLISLQYCTLKPILCLQTISPFIKKSFLIIPKRIYRQIELTNKYEQTAASIQIQKEKSLRTKFRVLIGFVSEFINKHVNAAESTPQTLLLRTFISKISSNYDDTPYQKSLCIF